jgi:hypothetical protein
MTEDAVCYRCGHAEDDHDPKLTYCNRRGCRCLMFRTEAEELEDSVAEGGELDFDHDA